MQCSLVVRAFNEERHIGRLLEGVHRQTIPNGEVILVDSGSANATPAIAAPHGVTVLHIPPEEFTFGRSLNLGMEAATCDLVAVASAHVYPVYMDWLERLLGPFADPQVAGMELAVAANILLSARDGNAPKASTARGGSDSI
jgi:rhamnosyltransferase